MSENTNNSLVPVTDLSLSSIGDPIEFPEVHLGQEGRQFKDKANFKTNNGFVIELSQASYGGTFIHASTEDSDKFTVEALTKDKSGETVWKKPFDPKGNVLVKGDWGNLDKLDNISMSDIFPDLGNPGIQHGFVKVTDTKHGSSKVFAVGAEFKGMADHWNVKAAYFEVVLSEKPKGIKETPQLGML